MNWENLVNWKNIDWWQFFWDIKAPFVTVALWFLLDRVIVRLKRNERFFAKLVISRKESNDHRQKTILQRIKTFRGLIFQIVRIIVALFFLFTLLNNFNIDPKPLLAGIGVVGLGLSLAAQNILRDFLNGLFFVIEDQFNVGDWVEIGDHQGSVENFSLRTTCLRTVDGRYIIIPNSTITQVVNHTKDWAVAYVELGVAYNADIEEVMGVLERSCEELKKMYWSSILEKSTIQAICDFRPSDLLIRVMTKTLPGEQWAIGRSLRKIIKENFDKAGLDIPLPQMVVHSYRREEAERTEMKKSAGPDEPGAA